MINRSIEVNEVETMEMTGTTIVKPPTPEMAVRNMEEEEEAARVCPPLSELTDQLQAQEVVKEIEEQPNTVEDAKESLAAMDLGLGKVEDSLEGSVEHDRALDETLPSNARLDTVAPSATEEEETKEKVKEVGEA